MTKKRKERGKGKRRRRKTTPADGPSKKLLRPSSELIVPLSPHEQRMYELGARFPPPPWASNHDLFRSYVERQAHLDIAIRLKAKEVCRKSPHWLFVLLHGGSGFTMATALRSYVAEFDHRIIQYGPHALPSSFNVLEAFLLYETAFLLFGLHPEREHLLDADQYLEWFAHEGSPHTPSQLMDIMEEEVIYSYDLTSSTTGFRVAGSESTFVLAGVSFVRHGAELSSFLLAGEQPPRHSDAEVEALFSRENWEGAPPGKEGVAPDPELTTKDRYLEACPDFCRTVMLTRFDLATSKHDVRYIALDAGASYTILSDDMAVLADVPESRRPSTADFSRYDALFSAFATLVYLPIAFVAMSDRIHEVQFPTELGSGDYEDATIAAERELGAEACAKNRTIRCLPVHRRTDSGMEKSIEPPQLDFHTDGFWKPLSPGQVGENKDGQPVAGRTWVTRHETWCANSPRSFLLTRSRPFPKGPDPGVVYIVRSPGHQLDMYKIGLTRRDADRRAGELSSPTGVPLPFAVLVSWEVGNCGAVERECHSRLEAMRVNPRREFFHGRLQDIVSIVNQVIADQEDR